MRDIWLKMERARGLASTRFHSRFTHSTNTAVVDPPQLDFTASGPLLLMRYF
jgi:hypothetical protein